MLAELYGISMGEGVKLTQNEKKKRKIEFFGDSDTAGYGILGPSASWKLPICILN
jgi:hypothetical protein